MYCSASQTLSDKKEQRAGTINIYQENTRTREDNSTPTHGEMCPFQKHILYLRIRLETIFKEFNILKYEETIRIQRTHWRPAKVRTYTQRFFTVIEPSIICPSVVGALD